MAELVGIQNHFHGRFHRHSPGWARLQWLGAHGALELQVIDKNRIDEGTPVTWVLRGEGVDVLQDGAAPAGPNVLRCRLAEVLPLGETSLCTLVPEVLPDQRIQLNLTGRLLRQLGAVPGSCVFLRLAPQALHIMPVK